MGTVPVRWSSATARDVAEVEEIVRRTYVNHRPTVPGPALRCQLCPDVAVFGALAVERVRHTVTARYVADPVDRFAADHRESSDRRPDTARDRRL